MKYSINKIEKFKELLIFIVKNFNNNETLTETKLWKLLYFCDADFFEENNKTITGINYYKNRFGATPDKNAIDKAVSELKDYLKIKKISKANGQTIKLYAPSDIEYKYKFLTVAEIEEARKICKKYYRLSVPEIVILAHSDPPYLGASCKEKIDFSFTIYREDETEDIEKTDNFYKGTISDEAAKKLLAYA